MGKAWITPYYSVILIFVGILEKNHRGALFDRFAYGEGIFEYAVGLLTNIRITYE